LITAGALIVGAGGVRPGIALAKGSNNDSGCGLADVEEYPTSPLVLEPFEDELPIPKALAPERYEDVAQWNPLPGPARQDASGEVHQLWPTQLGLPEPIYYRIKTQVNEHAFTTSKVQPINALGLPVPRPLSGALGPQTLPTSTIYGFNGTFPGPMINAEYGRPACVRFENELDLNPRNLSRNDFGSPEWKFLTHLHNAHTASESDGNPNHKPEAYSPGEWCDNMYLNYPAGSDMREIQSFFWFHDHVHNHTGADVYKGMVGIYPIYDPKLDSGDETKGLRLPGVRKDRSDGAFDVEYDIPLVLYDCILDDGVTPHQDEHNGCGELHPEWWGQTFFRHYGDGGFVGDIFTVNGVAYPVLEVKRRKYRLRFLDASVSRIYELKLMSSTTPPVTAASLGMTAKALQGQWRLPNARQCMRFTQIASEGGLLPYPIVRDSFELWPAKRREFIVDFTRYMDGTPTTKGDVIYLVDTLQMVNGRKPGADRFLEDEDGNTIVDPVTGQPVPNPDYDPNFKVPMLKIVIGDSAPDYSQIPRQMRPRPPLPSNWSSLPQRRFVLGRSGGLGPESQWLINGLPFDATRSLAQPVRGSAEVWTVVNDGGGWVHPLHIHEEEHIVISRNGKTTPDRRHVDDIGKEDVVALDKNETVVFYRKFRTFKGRYVAHCHNLLHEDHAMMFGWEIT
jgi:FtsP/CotA-like multicopper oxidase with cupredoxin domain